jgi:hypothetical protein
MMPGFGSLGEAELSEALDQICLAEGVTRDKLVLVDIIGGEISVRHVKSNGLSRTATYPRRSFALSRGKICWAQCRRVRSDADRRYDPKTASRAAAERSDLVAGQPSGTRA